MNAFEDEDLAERYARFADVMTVVRPQVSQWVMTAVLHYIQIPGVGSSREVDGLDLGCGHGRFTRLLWSICARVVGVDPSAAMLTLASKGHMADRETLDYQQAELLDWTYPADVVLSAFSSYQAGPAEKVFPHIASLVRPGGLGLVVDVTDLSSGRWADPYYQGTRGTRMVSATRLRVGQEPADAVSSLVRHPAWLAHMAAATPLTPPEFRRQCEHAMPGCTVHPLGDGIYAAAWTAP